LPDSGFSQAVVLDSSAVLAVLLGEDGRDVVIPILEGGLFSTVNLAKVRRCMIWLGASAARAWGCILNFQ